MKISRKSIIAAVMAVCMSVSIAGCSGGKDINNLTDKDIENALGGIDNNTPTASTPKELDPFETLELSFSDVSPFGRVKNVDVVYGKLTNGGSSAVNYKPDVTNGLKNGDTVTVTAELKSSYADKYVLTSTKKEFIVEGLPSYPEKLADIPKETMEKMDKTFRDGYNSFVEKNNYGTIKNMELIGNYMLFTNSTAVPDGAANYIYFVYKVTVDFSKVDASLSNKEYYWCAYYNNVIAEPDGTISADYDDLHMGAMDYFVADVWQIESCEDLDTLFNKNVASKADKYTYETTVK